MIWMVVFLNQVVRLEKPLDFDKDSWARIKKKKKKNFCPKFFGYKPWTYMGTSTYNQP